MLKLWLCSSAGRVLQGNAMPVTVFLQHAITLPTAERRDPMNDIHMGECAERCAEEFRISRAEQDDHAIESHRRAGQAARAGITAQALLEPVNLCIRALGSWVGQHVLVKPRALASLPRHFLRPSGLCLAGSVLAKWPHTSMNWSAGLICL